MATLLLTIYILVWPVIALSVLVLLWVAVAAEIRANRRSGKDIV